MSKLLQSSLNRGAATIGIGNMPERCAKVQAKRREAAMGRPNPHLVIREMSHWVSIVES